MRGNQAYNEFINFSTPGFSNLSQPFGLFHTLPQLNEKNSKHLKEVEAILEEQPLLNTAEIGMKTPVRLQWSFDRKLKMIQTCPFLNARNSSSRNVGNSPLNYICICISKTFENLLAIPRSLLLCEDFWAIRTMNDADRSPGFAKKLIASHKF